MQNVPDKTGETPMRTIELFCQDPELIYPPNGKKRNVQVLKNIKRFSQSYTICIQCKTPGNKRARLNCVDINSREVIEQYLFDILAEKPFVDRTVQLKSLRGTD